MHSSILARLSNRREWVGENGSIEGVSFEDEMGRDERMKNKIRHFGDLEVWKRADRNVVFCFAQNSVV